MPSKFDLARMLEKLDKAQTAGDVVGVADPTGVVDAGNAALSLFRAMAEPERRKEHMFNAVVSGISAIPYVGDLAKIAKIPGAAAKAGRGTRGARAAGEVSESAVEAGAAGHGHRRFSADSSRPDVSESRSHRSFAEVVSSGRNFGDLLGGKITPHQAMQDSEAYDAEIRAKKKLTDTVVGLTGAFGSLTVGSAALTNTIQSVSAAFLERQRHREAFSGNIAFAGARLDVGRLQREIQMAQGTDDTFGDLANAVNDLEKATAPYKMAAQNVQNKGLEQLNRVAAGVIKLVELFTPIDKIIEKLNEWLDEDKKPKPIGDVKILEDIAAGRVGGPKMKRRL